MKMTKTKWFLPAFCVALGWLIFARGVARRKPCAPVCTPWLG